LPFTAPAELSDALHPHAESADVDAARALEEAARERYERAVAQERELRTQLDSETAALKSASDAYARALAEHLNCLMDVGTLRLHIKENILYYMQAIWSHEPPDQRFFRLYDLEVPVVQPVVNGVTVNLASSDQAVIDWLRDRKTTSASLPMPDVTVTTKKLVEVADLDKVLGYKGNYAIFALTENNFITMHMMQDYLEVSDKVRLRDPDDSANYSVDDLQKLAQCLYRKNPDAFKEFKHRFKELMVERLTSGRAEDDRVIVPTNSLYIEALVGTHPLLEDFKLIHRALDVKKVQAEVRHAELENIRLAARAIKGKDEDPDIEKKIVVEGAPSAVIPGD